jgi:cell cycle checkpoint control protein RAD9A
MLAASVHPVNSTCLQMMTRNPDVAKSLAKSFACLSRVGEELMVEATPEKISFRSINCAKTAFAVLDVDSRHFDSYKNEGGTYHCRVSAKDLVNALKYTRGMHELNLLFDNDTNSVQISLKMKAGFSKFFTIAYIEGDIMSVGYSKLQCNLQIRGRSKLLAEVTRNMGAKHQELEIHLALNEAVIQSFTEGATEPDGSSNSSTISFEVGEFETYEAGGPGDTKLIFAMKEFRAFLDLCDSLELPFELNFTEAGAPIVLYTDVDAKDGEMANIEIVVATVLHEDQDDGTSQCSQSGHGHGQSQSQSQSQMSHQSESQAADSQNLLNTLEANNQSTFSDDMYQRQSSAHSVLASQGRQGATATMDGADDAGSGWISQPRQQYSQDSLQSHQNLDPSQGSSQGGYYRNAVTSQFEPVAKRQHLSQPRQKREPSPDFDGDAEDVAAGDSPAADDRWPPDRIQDFQQYGQTDEGDRLDDDEFVDCTPPESDADACDFG